MVRHGIAVVSILLIAHSAYADAQLQRLAIEPSSIVLDGADVRQQLLVTGRYADGSVADLTHLATFSIEKPKVASVAKGVVAGIADGKTTVVAKVNTHHATVIVSVRNAKKITPVSFRHDVMPIFSKHGCNAGTCHGNFNGKNGFRLSLRGEDPHFDWLSLTRDTNGRRTNPHNPAASLLLQKPVGRTPHEGGVRFTADSDEYKTLHRWIAEGMKFETGNIARLVKLEVTPSDRVLLHGRLQQQIVARAQFSDNTVRDVTHLAAYEPSSETVRVSKTGMVTAEKSTQATVVVRFLNQQVPVRLAFVPARPNFSWQPISEQNYIDKHIFARLKALQIQPSSLAEDAVFLRRAFLDVCGVLPSPKEVNAFLKDQDPDKRNKLIDSLLARPEYVDYWALKWADLLRNEEKAVDAKGVRLFHSWLRTTVANDRPLNQFVRELVTGRGSTYVHPAANYYRTNLDPQRAAETTALLFMGVRIACAKCHNHPFDRWTQEDYFGLSSFFARVRMRILNNKRKDRLDKHEFKGEMLIYLDREGEVDHPKTGDPMPPRLPNGVSLKLGSNADRLPALANWLTAKDNPFFAKVMANRIWYHLMGRGIVEPVDDFRSSNPPSHAELLDELAKDFIKHGFSQKHLIRRIMQSRTYQLSSKPTATNEDDEINFSHVHPKLLPAEVLLDAISQVTKVPEALEGFPPGTRAVQLPGVKGGPKFLKIFGRPDRLLACECERQSTTTLNQALQMITGEIITRKVNESPRIRSLLREKATNKEIVSEFYLAALSRPPTVRELDLVTARLERVPNRLRALEDLLWAMMNTKEFLLRR